MGTAATGHRARHELMPEGLQENRRPARRGGVRWSVLAWAAVMAVALLSSAVHLLDDGWVGMYRVGGASDLHGKDSHAGETA